MKILYKDYILFIYIFFLMHIGILCAMPQEIGKLLENLKILNERNFGDLKIISGQLSDENKEENILVSVAWSGWGKVSAARAATRLLSNPYSGKALDLILFTGVAGAADSSLKQWDVVIPNQLVQHDMDASPFFEKYVIPSLNQDKISAKEELVEWTCNILIDGLKKFNLDKFGFVKKGLIATGDKFIADKNSIDDLSANLPGLMAIEMEGAALAQVASQENIPWLIIRVVSDQADSSAPQSFKDFLKDYEKYSWFLIKILLQNINKAPI